MSGSFGIELYYHPVSPPCRAVLMVGRALNIKFNLREVDVLNGGTRHPSFIKLNPQHTIPVLNDNGFVLSESRAIMEYLVDAYGKNSKSESLFPKSAQARALVSARLYFDAATLYARFASTYLIPLVRGGDVTAANLQTLDESLSVLEEFLDNKSWVAGSDLTIADIALVTTVSSIDAVSHNLSQFPNIKRWYTECKRRIPGYDLNQVGADQLAAFYNDKFGN